MKTVRVLLIHFATTLVYASIVGACCYLALIKVGTGVGTQLTGLMTDTRATIQSTNALIKDAHESIDANYDDIQGTLDTVAVTARDSDDFVHDLHASLTGGKDAHGNLHQGLIEEARLLLSDSRGAVNAMHTDLDGITKSAEDALKPLGTALDHITRLTDTLDTQIKAGGAGAKETADQLTKSLADLDKLIADPDIQSILASSADTSKHLAGASESIDIAMKPWRKKASQIKMIIEKALGLIKFVVPL